ncbi:hypothetical protein BOTBODRAFT_183279 [Botryobasidium botryosum FD-172 SS1]|uniref:Uncharacterized protein n=1 Tax=Botryobasidium botryosum (strain FD-172 SS1) TaxID=930990 RepID=A0A067N9P1_BOTB1|nr:hypothetical protein BOTBODRAFT_183279 [Botryobasidium botryosum FD-172 SS1]
MPLLEALELELCDEMEGPALVAELTEFLRIHPTIRSVKLAGSAHTFMGLFIITPTRQLCPLLEDLHIGPCPSFDKAVLLEVVASRAGLMEASSSQDIIPLEDVFLHQCPLTCKATISLLDTFVNLVIIEGQIAPDNSNDFELDSEHGSPP